LHSKLKIVDYKPEHQLWFEKLNREWIEKYFAMEPPDYQILQDPEKYILANGGSVFMALYNQVVAGTVALKFLSPDVYELTKMAVSESFQGKKIGRALAEAAIARARSSGARKIVLYSNTMLESAIALYEKLGFVEIPVDGPYKRTNIKMQLIIV
jgi:ribosomal protein S18 acetylase RimI-like enzyme